MKIFKTIIIGAIIGIANIIPGVSGGTLAVSMGIYDDIIYAITHIFKDFKKSMKILLPIGTGAVIAIVGLSFAIEFLFEVYPLQTSMAFVGLILGGLPIIIKKVSGKKLGISHFITFLLFLTLVIGMTMLGGGSENAVVLNVNFVQVILLFGIGMLASATMVIPGVSGSMMLMLIGYYSPIISSITDFLKALVNFDVTEILNSIGILAPFGIGIIIGIFVMAKLIEMLLQKCETITYCGIIGLVIASPFAVLVGMKMTNVNTFSIIGGLVTFAIGFIISLKMSKE
jgi:putative membrane protein